MATIRALSQAALCGITPGSPVGAQITDANGKVVYSKYDALDPGQSMSCTKIESSADTITPADAVVVYIYRSCRLNAVLTTEANGHRSTTQYDALNRRSKETNPAGDVTTVTYDAVGNVTTDDLAQRQYWSLGAMTRSTG